MTTTAHPGFTLTDGSTLNFHGAADRYHKNVAAIRLLRALQAEGRTPASLSRAEQLTLAHYTAFGESTLLNRALGADAAGELDPLISEAERRALKRASLNAFYTSQDVLAAKWAALEPLLAQLPGTLKVLEPAFGIGNYIATMPLALRSRAQITAVELDSLSSQIAAYLHPDVQLYGGQGFEATELPADHFDLVISNVPFGQEAVFDPRLTAPYLTRTIHDYFIARALTLVRPGGLVAVITSYGTLDKRDARVRTWIAARAALVRAIRLPHGAFRANAGTECGADILLFHRYANHNEMAPPPTWIETTFAPVPIVNADGSAHATFTSLLRTGEYAQLAEDAGLLRMGRTFADQPAQIAGTPRLVRDGTRYLAQVLPPTECTVGAAVAKRLAALPIDLLVNGAALAPLPAPASAACLNRASPRAMGLLALYARAKRVIQLDLQGQDATAARATLDAAYDQFVERFGPIHARANSLALKGEPELLFLRALESDVVSTNGTISARKAPIFATPTIRTAPRIIAGSMTADEALLCCLDERGCVDLERIGALAGMSPDVAATTLAGRIYRDPTSQVYVTADAYLSGNIRQKLAAAEQAAVAEPRYAAHGAALQAALPADLTPGQIAVKFGAPWVPADVYMAFITTLIPGFAGSYGARGQITYLRPLARWAVADEAYSRRSHAATVAWGTGRMHALDIIEKGLNNQTPVIYDELDDGSRVVNQKETLLAREKLERIKEAWAAWIWEDTDRTERLCTLYNTQFNSTRRRDFDGSHLSLPGINTAILRGGDLAAHQKDAVWMILQTPSVLLDLCVGAGKTFICLAAAHELKRLGLAQKILITVPNHLVEQWAAEANRLYPAMRVLAMAADDVAKERRGTFLSRIATEDWDVIICAHTSFGLIEVGTIAGEYIAREVDELRSYLEELQRKPEHNRTDRRTMKEIERKILSFETRMKEKEHRVTHDDARIITWEELGIDALFVDEAHEFKNLAVPTLLGNLPGVPKGDSKRAFDMRIKTWDLRRRGGRVVFATGTPVLNTLGEVFIMQKYLQEDVLAAHGIEHFDAWASTFAETQTVFEMTPDGGGFRMNTRLCKFVNLPELFNLWFQMTFSRSREQLGLPTPTLVSGKPIPISVPGTPTLKRLVASFVRRVEAIKAGAVEPAEDNMLKVTSDGRKAALDVRLVRGGAEEPVCKINMLVATVAELYQRYDAAKATQLIYCELATPRPQRPAPDTPSAELLHDELNELAEAGPDKNFVYHEIRAKLAARGIPPAQVAFIQEHNTKTKRAALFAAMNRGDVRVLLASKQSTGMNIQQRLIALHNLDAPWRPGDLEQRVGRIERQGNAWPEVYVCNYVTESSFDGYTWQTLETKSRFIGQMRSGDVTIRAIDDISEVVLSAAEIKAIASGNPKVMRKVQLDAELITLASLQASYRDTQARLRRKLHDDAYTRARMAERRSLLLAAQALVGAQSDQEFTAAVVKSALTHEALLYTKRELAGQALRAIAMQVYAQAQASNQPVRRTIGAYRGLVLLAQVHPRAGAPEVVLAIEHHERIEPVAAYPVKCETDQGVFASVDAQVRGIAEAIRAIEAEFRAKDGEEAQIQAALAQPWDQAALYAALQTELEALNTELSGAQQPAPATADDLQSCDDLELAIVAEHDLSELPCPAPVIEAWAVLPPVALPAPADPLAMEAALLALQQANPRFAEPVAALAPASEEAPPEAVPAEVPSDLPATILVLAPTDLLPPARSSRSTLVFGDTAAVRRPQTRRQRQPASLDVGLVPPDPPHQPQQLALF